MDMFIAQLNQLFMSANEDDWLAGLFDLLRTHTMAHVCLTEHDGKIILESLPTSGIRPNADAYSMSKPVVADTSTQLSLTRDTPFTEAEGQMMDIVLCICTLLLRQQENQAYARRKQRLEAVREAINALSFSELEAAIHIFQAIDGSDGRLVAGHVADRLGFTRSVVVNALKKLEGAGIIETRSLGVKGTYIRIKDTVFVEELGKLSTGKSF